MLSALEASTYRSTAASFDALHRLLLDLQGNDPELIALRGLQDAPASVERFREVSTVATRVVALAGSLLLSDQLTLNDQRFLALFIRMNDLGSVAATSGYGGTDHLLHALGVSDTTSLLELARHDRQRFLKALMLLSLDSTIPLDVESLLQAEPMLGSLVVLRLLSSGRALSAAGEQARNRLLQAAGHLKPFIPKDLNCLVLLANTWMMCSYAELHEKHRIKPVLNRYLRTWLAELGLHDQAMLECGTENIKVTHGHSEGSPPHQSCPTGCGSERAHLPCLLVAAEVIHSNHVQYRYFGQYIRQLRTQFRVVLLAEEAQVDTHVRALVDEVQTFTRGTTVAYLKEVRERIVQQQPDVIFWLSVGMRHWGVALANLRLAPLQIAGFGHGAYTFCDTIDFYLCEAGYVAEGARVAAGGGPAADAEDSRERLLLVPDESLVFEKSPHYAAIEPLQQGSPRREDPQDHQDRPSAVGAARETSTLQSAQLRPRRRDADFSVTAAVPSNLLKLNSAYLTTLRHVQVAAEVRGRRLRFKFFPNQQGLQLAMTTSVLQRSLQEVVVMPMLRYQAYMEELSACDINLSSFPFGSVHSVIDSLQLGLPVVVMEALEPHARADAMLLRRLRLPEWLICRNTDDYGACALRLIVDDTLRASLSRLALDLKVGEVMFGDSTTALRKEVVQAVAWAYAQRHTFKNDPRRCFTTRDFL